MAAVLLLIFAPAQGQWDLSGAAQDIQLLLEVGYQVANGDKWPEWKPGTEFKAKRDKMLNR